MHQKDSPFRKTQTTLVTKIPENKQGNLGAGWGEVNSVH